MSLNNDIETLYVSALENYASEQCISFEEASAKFISHFVHENMLSQHEYLHQIPMEEIYAYVSTLLNSEITELPLYHGSIYEFKTVDLAQSKDRRDFGKGFYTTVLESQAIQWAKKLAQRNHVKKHYLYQFLFTPNARLRIKRFDSMNLEWLEFIKENRIQGGLRHNYDIVIGPVADDDTLPTLLLYLDGTLNANAAIEMLKYNQVNNQVSFHTQKGLEVLHFDRRYDYE